jgi:hypothetical protein
LLPHLKEEHRLRVFGNVVLSGTLGPTRQTNKRMTKVTKRGVFISASRQAILNEVFRGFPQSFQANAGIVP